jgi:hypothetical protein
MKDITTIRGYCEACHDVQVDIMNTIKNEGITHFISLGDWFDGGYGSDVAAALCHADIDREMAELLKGNFYGVIGNHIRINMDSNPELFLIQPHPYYTSRHNVQRTEQIIKTPDRIVLNGAEIILMHWNPVADCAKDYTTHIDSECQHHIALYHTEHVIPASLLHDMNMAYEISDDSAIADALSGVEIAIVGHIHKRIGTHVIKSRTGNDTLMIVPGSLTNTDAGERARHDYIDMPLIDIYEDGSIKLSYIRQTLHHEKITFYQKKSNDDTIKDKLKSLRGNSTEKLYEDFEAAAFIGESNTFLSLNRFITNMGYTRNDRVMINSILKNPEDIDTLRILTYEDKGELTL